MQMAQEIQKHDYMRKTFQKIIPQDDTKAQTQGNISECSALFYNLTQLLR